MDILSDDGRATRAPRIGRPADIGVQDVAPRNDEQKEEGDRAGGERPHDVGIQPTGGPERLRDARRPDQLPRTSATK